MASVSESDVYQVLSYHIWKIGREIRNEKDEDGELQGMLTPARLN